MVTSQSLSTFLVKSPISILKFDWELQCTENEIEIVVPPKLNLPHEVYVKCDQNNRPDAALWLKDQISGQKRFDLNLHLRIYHIHASQI